MASRALCTPFSQSWDSYGLRFYKLSNSIIRERNSMEHNPKKVVKPSAFSTNSNSSTMKENESKKRQIVIADRFIVKSCIFSGSFYKAYRSIDMVTRKFVTMYIKPVALHLYSFRRKNRSPKTSKKNWRKKSPHLLFGRRLIKSTKTSSILKSMPNSAPLFTKSWPFIRRKFPCKLSSFWPTI